jgi:hypothetical protein
MHSITNWAFFDSIATTSHVVRCDSGPPAFRVGHFSFYGGHMISNTPPAPATSSAGARRDHLVNDLAYLLARHWIERTTSGTLLGQDALKAQDNSSSGGAPERQDE